MADEKTRAEQEQQAVYDVQNGLGPDPNGDQFYLNAYNAEVAKNLEKNQNEKSGG